jgi:HK97 family phage major capsid protein
MKDIKLNLDIEGKSPEEQAKIINANLKSIGDGLKEYAEQSEKEIKAKGELVQETRASVDELLAKQTDWQNQLSEVMQKLDDMPSHTVVSGKIQTLGQRVLNAEGAKERLAQMKADGRNGKFQIEINAAMTNDSLGISEADRQGGIAEIGRQNLRIRDLLRQGRTSSDSVTFWRQTTRTNAADVVSENPAAGKPESDTGGALQSAPVATIAHWEKASRQVLSDYPMLQSFIDAELRYGLGVKEEEQLLYGTGTGLEIEGIHTAATAYSQPAGVAVTAESRVDRLRLAILQAELANYYCDGIALSLVDWANIEIEKDANNNYLYGNPYGMLIPTLWGRPVVSSASVQTDDFIVGAFQTAAMLWDRESVNVSISYEDQDNFVKNMVTILAENRIALTIKQTGAFIKGDFQGLAT